MRVRIVYKRHSNLKEMLLGDILQKCMMVIETAEYIKKNQKKKGSCRHKVDGHCIYRDIRVCPEPHMDFMYPHFRLFRPNMGPVI